MKYQLYPLTHRDLARRVVEELETREAEVVRRYYGLDGVPMTLTDIGKSWGVSREWVRQVKDQALAKLRRSARGKQLRPHAQDMEEI